MGTQLPTFTAKQAADVAGVADLSPEGLALLRPQAPPGAFLDALTGAGLYADAVKFLAHGLGRREAVWWACMCCRATMEPTPAPEAVRALTAAETFCRAPTEENRRAAHAAAEAGAMEHPAGLAALGAFFSGGSMAPPHVQQPVPPGPLLTAKVVAGSVQLSAVRCRPELAPQKFARFVEYGIAAAQPPAAAQPHPPRRS